MCSSTTSYSAYGNVYTTSVLQFFQHGYVFWTSKKLIQWYFTIENAERGREIYNSLDTGCAHMSESNRMHRLHLGGGDVESVMHTDDEELVLGIHIQEEAGYIERYYDDRITRSNRTTCTDSCLSIAKNVSVILRLSELPRKNSRFPHSVSDLLT